MNSLVVAFGLLILALGAIGIVSPRAVIGTMLAWKPQTLLTVAVGVRAFMGIVLLLAASGCRHPTAVTVLGWVALLAAAVGLAVGRERLDMLVRWWSERPPNLTRVSFTFAGAFGAWLVYTALP